MKRKWDVSSDQTRKQCVDEVVTRLKEQGSAIFGVIAAGDIIDIVAQNIGPDIYNKALEDVRKLVENKLSDIEVQIDLLRSDS